MYSPAKINAIAERFDRHVSAPLDSAGRALLAIDADAPVAYGADYGRFVRRWGAADRALFDMVSKIYDLAQPAYNRDAGAYHRSLAVLLDADHSTFQQLTRLISDARLLSLGKCGGGLAGLAGELQALNDIAVGRQTSIG
jgi:hypothetical protein